jgi:diaminohydroxyphosphoribosylaminopyrimidine deaminase/5-amino-6-(5-phosphoribosylamino)uracil reductase
MGKENGVWESLLARRHQGAAPMARSSDPAAAALLDLYLPYAEVPRGRSFIVGHLGQSLDGRIATPAGVSRWVTGEDDLIHTHRMRALADAILVGSGTVCHDDPQLTVRRCGGRHPVRVVIDAERRLGAGHRLFEDDAAPTLLLAAGDRVSPGERLGRAEVLGLPRGSDGIAPADIVAALAARGLRFLFIEGGGITISRFLAAGALDRLQLTVAPILLGAGKPSLILPAVAAPAAALKPRLRRFALGRDTLYECIFRD